VVVRYGVERRARSTEGKMVESLPISHQKVLSFFLPGGYRGSKSHSKTPIILSKSDVLGLGVSKAC